MQRPSPPQVTFDEYVGMCGAAKAWGVERMCGYYRIEPRAWPALVSAWNATTASNAHFPALVDQEAARLQMGGQARFVASLSYRELEHGAAQVGSALDNLFGGAFAGIAKAVAPPGPGTAVMVLWSDGQRYPGTVAQVGQGQYLVTMASGQQHWVAAQFVTLP
jgi:hypothetical protein